MLTVYCGNDSFTINREEANRLEIAFNRSEKGREWLEIGDVLFEYSIGAYEGNLTLEPHKFKFLFKLLQE